MNIDDALEGVYDADQIAQKHAVARAAYEERIVKKILAKTGLGDQAKQLAAEVKEKTGQYRLTFSWFYEYHRSFPIWLAIRKVHYAYQITIKDLFNKFCSTPMFKLWEELKDESPLEDKPVGLIFDWPGVSGTQMIIHNDCVGATTFTHDVRITRLVGQGRASKLITIEQFEPYFDKILRTWTP